MNRLNRAAAVAGLVAGGMLGWAGLTGPAAANAQTIRGVPLEIVTAQDARGSAAALAQHLSTKVLAPLSADALDAKALTEARADLTEPVASKPQIVSPSFVDVYCDQINVVLGSKVNTLPLRSRVNVGVGVARIAEVAAANNNIRLVDTVVVLLGDKEDAVAYWGAKAARRLMPAVAVSPLSAVRANLFTAMGRCYDGRKNGLIAAEMYSAYAYGNDLGLLTPERVKATAQPILDLFTKRAAEHVSGNVNDPAAEAQSVVAFVSLNRNWAQLTAAQKLQAGQAMLDILDVNAQRGAKATRQEDKDLYLAVVTQMARGLNIIANDGKDANLAAATDKLAKLKGHELPGAPQLVAAVATAMTANPDFKGIRTAGGGAPANAGATRSNTAGDSTTTASAGNR